MSHGVKVKVGASPSCMLCWVRTYGNQIIGQTCRQGETGTWEL